MIAIIAGLIFPGLAMAGHQGAAGTLNCTSCHTTNLIAEHGGFNNASCSRCHSSQASAVLATIAKGNLGQAVSCGDCHGSATHLVKHSGPGGYILGFSGYQGVEPGPAAIWTQPTSFTAKNPPLTSDYQLCLRCHSYNGLGTMLNGISSYTGPSGVKLTDQAMEFNINNKSAHPVERTLNEQAGSYAPKALPAKALKAPWNVKVGMQTMKCGDCHSYDPTGPQGANVNFMLKGPATYWPKNSSGTLFKLGSSGSGLTQLFCTNCHTVGSGYRNGVHGEDDHNGYACVHCHLAVPHGGKRSRLIVYKTDPAPYNYNGNSTTMIQFRKRSGSYSENDCKASCDDDHSGSVSGADQ